VEQEALSHCKESVALALIRHFGSLKALARASARRTNLQNPALEWVKLAEGMGVEAARAETTERFADLFASAMKTRGPRLIEAVI
jgi:thiamine pyrophosphate-dependent acetolactate synthase large subunit-like protein